MYNNRREFLKVAAMLTGGVALSSLTGCKSGAKLSGSNKPFGLQLYTLRDDMAKDPMGTLKKVASFGYKQIESFEGSKGIFWGMGNTGFKKYMDDLGMTIVSSHCDINKDFEKKAEEAAAIGMKYLICPYYGAQKTIDDYKKGADIFNARGQVCKNAGLRFAYHNHEYTFEPMDNQMPQDVFMQNTDKDLVDYEMDVYWVVTANQDPIAWMNKYPDRWKLFHIKDRNKDAAPNTREAFVALGSGKINYNEITRHAQKQGNPFFIVEQDKTDQLPLAIAELNAAYMKNQIMAKL